MKQWTLVMAALALVACSSGSKSDSGNPTRIPLLKETADATNCVELVAAAGSSEPGPCVEDPGETEPGVCEKITVCTTSEPAECSEVCVELEVDRNDCPEVLEYNDKNGEPIEVCVAPEQPEEVPPSCTGDGNTDPGDDDDDNGDDGIPVPANEGDEGVPPIYTCDCFTVCPAIEPSNGCSTYCTDEPIEPGDDQNCVISSDGEVSCPPSDGGDDNEPGESDPGEGNDEGDNDDLQ